MPLTKLWLSDTTQSRQGDTEAEHVLNPFQVNVVVMKGQNEDEIPQFVEMTRDRPINVRFIEYMPFDGNRWSRSSVVGFHRQEFWN